MHFQDANGESLLIVIIFCSVGSALQLAILQGKIKKLTPRVAIAEVASAFTIMLSVMMILMEYKQSIYVAVAAIAICAHAGKGAIFGVVWVLEHKLGIKGLREFFVDGGLLDDRAEKAASARAADGASEPTQEDENV